MPDDYSNSGHQLVSNGDTVYYINTEDNIFLELKCSGSIQDCDWIKMDQKLEFPRSNAVATLIPDHLATCTN